MWESRVDCSNCGEQTYSKSKGHLLPNAEYPADTTCPVFDSNTDGGLFSDEGIIILPGEGLNDYVHDELLPELLGFGNVYTAEHNPGGLEFLYDYYWDRCGNTMETWLQQNPGGLVVIAKGYDWASEQGRWIHESLAIDYQISEGGPKNVGEYNSLHYFYVDVPLLAADEKTTENWPYPYTPNCNSPLPTDGEPNGEYSVWILKAGCEWTDYVSSRLRIEDDCENWSRSENLVPEGELILEIASPEEEEEFEYDEEVTFIADITGDPRYENMEEYIQWEIVLPANYQTLVLSDFTGPDFVVRIRDCELKVQASLNACGVQPVIRTVYDAPEFTIVDIGYLVKEVNNTNLPHYGSYWLAKHPSDAVIINREESEIQEQGTCEIDVVIKAEIKSDCYDRSDSFVDAST